VVVPQTESLAFGRTNIERDGLAGWGYEGRFLGLATDGFLHRVWGDFVCKDSMWRVRNLGALWPIRIVLPSGAPVDVMPWLERERRLGSPPDLLGISQGNFEVDLTCGPGHYQLRCVVEGSNDGIEKTLPSQVAGVPTRGLGQEAAESITENEFAVLWAMTKEYREAVDNRVEGRSAPAPLSYLRIRRILGLTSERQATAATERLVRRFREASLLDRVEAENQREAMCLIAVNQGVLSMLTAKYGAPGTSVVEPQG